MTNEIFISVVICNYNYDRYIVEAIESALSQDYSKYEVIIVDDGSTDNSVQIIREYQEKYLKKIVAIFQNNKGQAAGFNAAFRIAKGEVVSFLDSDDFWLPGKLKFVNQYFSNFDDIGVLQHNLKIVSGEERTSQNFRDILISGDYFAETQKKKSLPQFVPTSGLSFHRNTLEKVLPIPEAFKTCADGYLTRTNFCYGNVYSDLKTHGCYRLHSSNSIFGNENHNNHDYVWKLLIPHLNTYYRRNNIDLRLPQIRTRPKISRYFNPMYLKRNRISIVSQIYDSFRTASRKVGYVIDKGDRELRKLQDVHAGKKCFILGRDVDFRKFDISALKHEFVIISDTNAGEEKVLGLENGYYCISDLRVWGNGKGVTPNLVSFLRKTPALTKLFELPAKPLLKPYPELASQHMLFKNVNRNLHLWKGYFETDITKHLCWGFHVVLDMCLPLAFYLGFSEINLIGCSWNHAIESERLKKFFSLYAYDDHYNLTENILPYESIYGPIEDIWQSGYEQLKQVFANHNKKIITN